MSALEFAADTLPWLDRLQPEVDDYVARVGGSPELRDRLLHFGQFGFVTFPGLIDHDLIDCYLEDVDDLLAHRAGGETMVNVEGFGESPVSERTAEELANPHMRIMDFHNQSVAGKKIMLNETLVEFLAHVFRDTIVAMQSLTFIHGTEQTAHQDFAYVVPQVPSHLAATWVALEDVHPDAGPLGYYPGSHTVRKFDWGGGSMFLTPDSTKDPLDFARYLEAECERVGLKETTFLARKGDVFVWHAALVHAGTPAGDQRHTRKSFVTHYSSLSGYPVDRRAPQETPQRIEMNGGYVYVDPVRQACEDTFTRGERF